MSSQNDVEVSSLNMEEVKNESIIHQWNQEKKIVDLKVQQEKMKVEQEKMKVEQEKMKVDILKMKLNMKKRKGEVHESTYKSTFKRRRAPSNFPASRPSIPAPEGPEPTYRPASPEYIPASETNEYPPESPPRCLFPHNFPYSPRYFRSPPRYSPASPISEIYPGSSKSSPL